MSGQGGTRHKFCLHPVGHGSAQSRPSPDVSFSAPLVHSTFTAARRNFLVLLMRRMGRLLTVRREDESLFRCLLC